MAIPTVNSADEIRPMPISALEERLKGLKGWTYDNGRIKKSFTFKDRYHLYAFLNALLWISRALNHDPSVSYRYKDCDVSLSTHAILAITDIDLLYAEKIEA